MPPRAGSEAAYAAAEKLRTQCFRESGSLFWPHTLLWTDSNLDATSELLRNFEPGPDVLNRLARALHEHVEAARLIVELLLIYYLIPSRMYGDTKVRIIKDFATAANIAIPADESWRGMFEQGLANTGIHYQTSQIRQLSYTVAFAQTLRRLQTDLWDRDDVVKAANEAMTIVSGAETRAALLHLLFPNDFEAIVSSAHKRKIVAAFQTYGADARDLDQKLRLIRRGLEAEYNKPVDNFYAPEIRQRWLADSLDTDDVLPEPADLSGVPFSPLPATTNASGKPDSDRFTKLVENTLWSEDSLKELIELLTTPGTQVVLAGPPGTSKTWVMREVIAYLTNDQQHRIKFVQFHPGYTYEQFVEGLRPQATSTGGGIAFANQNGVVLDFVQGMKGDDSYYILIDEINRANLPRVFGELLVLFEYRDEPITLTYSGGFSLPENLHFVGTMNTADRSIRSIDAAFRRRFDIIECFPDASILQAYYAKHDNSVPNLRAGFESLNFSLTRDLGRHYQVGHAFFMRPQMTPDLLKAIWRRKVYPLLEEYFFDQPKLLENYAFEGLWPET